MARTAVHVGSRRATGLVLALLGALVRIGLAPVAAVGVADDPVPYRLLAPGLRAELAIDPTLRIGLGFDLPVRTVPASTADVLATAPADARPAMADPGTAKPAVVAKPHAYAGRNHVWSAAFGLDRGVDWFSCSRSRPPDMAVYRWGCAGSDNVYLFAHAGGPFQRLHDLYIRGRLRPGMTVTYADGSGRVHRYAVAWWRVVLPTDGDFAFAAQSRPSMTLQTCVGPNSRYRLVVRLYQTD